MDTISSQPVRLSEWINTGYATFKRAWRELIGVTAVGFGIAIATSVILSLIYYAVLILVFVVGGVIAETGADISEGGMIVLAVLGGVLFLVVFALLMIGSMWAAFFWIGSVLWTAVQSARGIKVTLAEALAVGARRALSLALYYLLPFLGLFLLFAIILVPLIMMSSAALSFLENIPEEAIFPFILLLELVFLVVALFVQSLVGYGYPLLVEKRSRFWAAYRLSARGFLRHPGKNLLLFLLCFFLYMIGLLFCYVGAIVTLPLAACIFATAYDEIYPREEESQSVTEGGLS